jgi:hypothetical protein
MPSQHGCMRPRCASFLIAPMPRATLAEGLARCFCHALAEETAGMTPGSWRMVDTIARRMGIPFDEGSTIADDCAGRKWVNHGSTRLSSERKGARSLRPRAGPSWRSGSQRLGSVACGRFSGNLQAMGVPMERGLLVELSPNEETALQRIAQGIMLTVDMESHHLARLKQLALIEETGADFRLANLGKRRLELRGTAPPKAD